MTNQVRIRGLVALQRSLQASLQVPGMDDSRLAMIQTKAEAAVAEVARICLSHRVEMSDLPTPSKRALDVLRSIAEGSTAGLLALAPPTAPDAVLLSSFQRVNLAYFAGSLPRPELRWSKRITWREFGRCQNEPPVVTISRSLAGSSIPQAVLDFVMFHELLHLQVGLIRRGKQVRSHTAAFRKVERGHPDYAFASSYLTDLSGRLRKRTPRRTQRRRANRR